MARANDGLRNLVCTLRWAPVWGLAALVLAGCSVAPPTLVVADGVRQPEAASGLLDKRGTATRTYAVAAANPLATRAGQQILQSGGSAVDAAIAVQMVLGLVEPQSSGIGGGAFLVHFDGRRVQAFDGREVAPAGVTPRLFLDAAGKSMPFVEAVVGGRSVGVPGTVAMLAQAHGQHGKLPWAELFAPAIRLADEGFVVSPRMATLLATEQHLRKDPVAAQYFYGPDGQPWPQGQVLRNPEYAEVLRDIAANGPHAFYGGALAEAMVQKVRSHPMNPGTLAISDLRAYQPVLREPLCFDHRAASSGREYRICGMPPPSSGTLAIGQILGILNHTPADAQPLANGLPATDWLHWYAEASRLAFADRALFVADPAFVAAPGGNWARMLATDYLQSRARLIDLSPGSPRMPVAPAGRPGDLPLAFAPMPAQEEFGTSHISIVDAFGNALAMTTTIEDAWGARQMVNRGKGLSGGFLLNNELTDFSFAPAAADGTPIANRVEPGKRPRSSMSPVLVFDKVSGKLVMSAGSPGGALIIHFTTKAVYGALHWGLDAQQAVSLPNFAAFEDAVLLEADRFSPATVAGLQARGHKVNQPPLPSGLQAISVTPTGYFGGADPRREGVVLGD